MMHDLLDKAWRALDLPGDALSRLSVTGDARWPSCFAVTPMALASIGAACLAVSELAGGPRVTLDSRLASLWFNWTLVPEGWTLPSAWDAVAGDYKAADGWIRLHTNAPHHRAAAVAVLGCADTRDAVTAAVAGWSAGALEQAVVAAGGCAAVMHSPEAWRDHAQGRAVRAEPIFAIRPGTLAQTTWQPTPGRPLAGLRVLDLTRVLAGPVGTRFLAGYGADVLRIDPPGWDEPGVVPEVTLGKRCARLDLRDPAHRARFEALLSRADVLVHGYRPGALEGLGYGEAERQALRPGLIDVSHSAYGHTGPWRGRRGFDSLVQMSCGIAAAGMRWKAADKPTPLPVQALDHATGYLVAAAVVRGLIARQRTGMGSITRLSLARTAQWLMDHPATPETAPMPGLAEADLAPGIEHTAWGPARRARPPAVIEGAPMSWPLPAGELGAVEAA
ncbi:CoA transferase [Rhodovarius crocodyli]|nr:CoA transferase [Rhodovarius crocodyli]